MKVGIIRFTLALSFARAVNHAIICEKMKPLSINTSLMPKKEKVRSISTETTLKPKS